MGEAVRRRDDDGAELFADAVSGAQPLANRERARPPAPASGARGAVAEPPSPGLLLTEDGSRGRAPDVSKKTLRELAAGGFPPRATLDLHRLTLESARERVAAFLAEARAAGHRSVLIITGMAERSPEGARLRDHVPGWLAGQPGGSVLAFAPARPEHGGAGALYVLIRQP